MTHPAPAEDRSTRRFLWGFFLAFFSIPTGVLLLIGNAFSGDSTALLARLDAAERGTSGERVVTGTVRPAKDEALLRAPASGQPCVAFETVVDMSWTEQDSKGDDERRTAVVASGGEAMAFDVDDAQAGLLASVREPRLDLRAQAVTTPLDGVPAWASRLRDSGGASPRSGVSYSAVERTLAPGQTVTLLGALARDGAPRMTPGTGQARVTAYRGSVEDWREEAHSMARAAWWLRRIAAALAAVAVVMLAGLVRTFFPRRA